MGNSYGNESVCEILEDGGFLFFVLLCIKLFFYGLEKGLGIV